MEKLFVACEGHYYGGQGTVSIIEDLNVMSEITDVKYASNQNKSVNAVIDGITWAVPVDNNNSDYQEVLKWVDAGNTIADAD